MNISNKGKTSRLWGGLCNGNEGADNIKDADIIVFGIPFDGNVSYRDGAKRWTSYYNRNPLRRYLLLQSILKI